MADWCEARCTPSCWGRASQRHHLVRRSQGGTDGPTLDVCTYCHTYIHDHPAESYERGWLIRASEHRTDDPVTAGGPAASAVAVESGQVLSSPVPTPAEPTKGDPT